MDAIDAFDLEYKVKFETYCAPRIRGAILDELRSMDWVPRLVRHRIRQGRAGRQRIEMEQKLGAPPVTGDRRPPRHDKDELDKYLREATAVGPSASTDSSTRKRRRPARPARDRHHPGRGAGQPPRRHPAQRPQGTDHQGPQPRRALIVLLYYYEGMTMKEIGATLDLSESRVSQMHSSILARLKAQMQHRMKELEGAAE
jgi:RNA polymerase sigma factor FliA